MDRPKRQTATATPAKPGGLPLTLAGISIGRCLTIALVIAGVLAAVGAIISGSQLGSGQPLAAVGYLLPAYAGAFLGATTITPGRFNVWGTLVGVYLLGAGVTGLQQVGLRLGCKISSTEPCCCWPSPFRVTSPVFAVRAADRFTRLSRSFHAEEWATNGHCRRCAQRSHRCRRWNF